MISCSFSSAWVLFSSASHSTVSLFPWKSLKWVSLRLQLQPLLHNTRVPLLPARPPAPHLPSGKGTTWERNDTGLAASDETIPQVTLWSSSEAVADAAFCKTWPISPGGEFSARGRESPGKSLEARDIPPVLFSASSERAQNCVPCQVQGGEVLLRGGRGLGCAEQTRKTTEWRKRGGRGAGGGPPLRSRHLRFPTVRRRVGSIPSLCALDPRTRPRPGRSGELPSGEGTPLAGEGLCARVIPAPAALEPAVEGGSAAGTARVTHSRTCARAPSLAPGSGRTRRAPGKPPAGVPRM